MKREIKENAIRLFCENGFEGASVRNISDSVGITAAAVYAHFKSKEDLFLEIYAEGWRDMIEGVKSIIGQKKELNAELLFTVFKYHFNYYMNNKEKTIFLFRSIMFPPRQLKVKVIEIFYRESKDIHKFMKCIFKKLIDIGTIKNISVDEHFRIFYKFSGSFIFETTVFDKAITEEEIDNHWKYYWLLVRV